MPWKNTITVGCAYDLLRADLLDQLRYLQKNIGYRYCRFHAIFDDRLGVVSRDSRGNLVFQWDQVDRIYDALLSMNLKPFVELNPMPRTSGQRYKNNIRI